MLVNIPSMVLFSVCLFLYVCLFRLNLRESSDVYASGFCLDDECWRLYEQKVHNILVEGLRDRVKLVRVIWENTSSKCIVENVCD